MAPSRLITYPSRGAHIIAHLAFVQVTGLQVTQLPNCSLGIGCGSFGHKVSKHSRYQIRITQASANYPEGTLGGIKLLGVFCSLTGI